MRLAHYKNDRFWSGDVWNEEKRAKSGKWRNNCSFQTLSLKERPFNKILTLACVLYALFVLYAYFMRL